MNFAAASGSPLRSGYALLRDDPTAAHYATNRQGIHLTEAKRCSEQPDHLSYRPEPGEITVESTHASLGIMLHTKAGHMTARDCLDQNTKKSLQAGGHPHMTGRG